MLVLLIVRSKIGSGPSAGVTRPEEIMHRGHELLESGVMEQRLMIACAGGWWLYLFCRFGDATWLSAGALEGCKSVCGMAEAARDADMVVYNLGVAMGSVKPRSDQVRAVLNMEAHSISAASLADTDVLISFHREAHVQVSYAYVRVPCFPSAN